MYRVTYWDYTDNEDGVLKALALDDMDAVSKAVTAIVYHPDKQLDSFWDTRTCTPPCHHASTTSTAPTPPR